MYCKRLLHEIDRNRDIRAKCHQLKMIEIQSKYCQNLVEIRTKYSSNTAFFNLFLLCVTCNSTPQVTLGPREKAFDIFNILKGVLQT